MLNSAPLRAASLACSQIVGGSLVGFQALVLVGAALMGCYVARRRVAAACCCCCAQHASPRNPKEKFSLNFSASLRQAFV